VSAMRLPRLSTRWWMVAVAVAAIAAWVIRRDGPHALAWEAPLLGASLAMGMVNKPQRLAAGILGGAITGAALAMGAGIGGVGVARQLETGVGIGGAVVGSIVGLFAAWVATVGSCVLRSYTPVELPDASGADSPHRL
jgi:hypothetical protein